MKTRLLVALALLLPAALLGSGRYEISLLTCSPGPELYAAFGHSALRVIDREKGTDVTYNFGLFDFSTPHFYVKFGKGDLLYYLGKQSTARFIANYVERHSMVTEQKLGLSDRQADSMVERLEYLYLPENREYLYKFIARNCTTELRDLIFDITGMVKPQQPAPHTYRYYINSCLTYKPFEELGLNIILGSHLDEHGPLYRALFLPELLSRYLADARTGDGRPLVKDTVTYGAAAPTPWRGWPYVPSVIFLAVLIWVALSKSNFPGNLVFLLSGSVSLVIMWLMLFSNHIEVQNNFNLLWSNPLYLILPFLGKPRLAKINFWLCLVSILAIGALYAVWAFKIQGFTLPILIITLTLLVALVKRIAAPRRTRR